VTIEGFTPGSALIGGALIGLAATMLYVAIGRIAGVSGIAGGLMRGGITDAPWRLLFLGGLVVGAALTALVAGVPSIRVEAAWPVLVVAGLLVGYGTQLGSGCTSGHGVCGIARFSLRSIAATIVFMAAAALTVFVVRHALGGA
jgi:uncharacterized membrane protein YedE/YeeE